MRQFALAVGLLVTVAAPPAGASTELVITGLPANNEYVPGSTFSFDLHAPNIADFSNYNIDFDVTTNGAITDSIVSLTVAKSGAGYPDYPFPPPSNFHSSVGLVSSNQLAVHIDDNAAPVDTRPAGAADFLVRVTVVTAAGATDDIHFAFNPGTFSVGRNEELTPDVSPPADFTIRVARSAPQPVPAPAAWVMLGLGGAVLAAGRKRFARV